MQLSISPTRTRGTPTVLFLSSYTPGWYFWHVSKKSGKIAALIESCRGGRHDAHYLGYFECFNRGLYYEAHDVLEELWLADRTGPSGNFYKGLIQLAGAFVLMQKHSSARPRLQPAARLLGLTRDNLGGYVPVFQDLDVTAVIELIDDWLGKLEKATSSPLNAESAPKLQLLQR
jgi:predicted metal-dependent hydrolase